MAVSSVLVADAVAGGLLNAVGGSPSPSGSARVSEPALPPPLPRDRAVSELGARRRATFCSSASASGGPWALGRVRLSRGGEEAGRGPAAAVAESKGTLFCKLRDETRPEPCGRRGQLAGEGAPSALDGGAVGVGGAADGFTPRGLMGHRELCSGVPGSHFQGRVSRSRALAFGPSHFMFPLGSISGFCPVGARPQPAWHNRRCLQTWPLAGQCPPAVNAAL